MKKILVLLSIALIFLITYFILVPADSKSSVRTIGKTNIDGAFRKLSGLHTWNNWWPGEVDLVFNNHRYKVNKIMYNGFEIAIQAKKDSVTSTLQFLPLTIDSTIIDWSLEKDESNNILKRLFGSGSRRKIKKDMSIILDSLKYFLEDMRNIYGFRVKEVRVTDSVLVSTRASFHVYPDSAAVDQMVKKLRAHIKKNGGREMNYPMLHVLRIDNNNYEAMVAIPVDRLFPPTNDFEPKVVLKGGKLLEADVTGGPHTIREAVKQFDFYMLDYKRIAPAKPYQLMITDRVAEQDTTKWLTRLCYPVY